MTFKTNRIQKNVTKVLFNGDQWTAHLEQGTLAAASSVRADSFV